MLGTAILLLFAAGLYMFSEAGAYWVDCPHESVATESYGLDTRVEAWPPGKKCLRAGARQSSEVYNAPDRAYYSQELVSGTRWAILGLASVAIAVLIAGLALEIQRAHRSTQPA